VQLPGLLLSKDKKVIKKLIDFETRKSVHINMTRNTHAEFRKILFDYSLSMQEVVEYFAVLVSENDNSAIRIVKEAFNIKRNKSISKVTAKETENLYDVISQEDPFSK
jgi:hypothetical protein